MSLSSSASVRASSRVAQNHEMQLALAESQAAAAAAANAAAKAQHKLAAAAAAAPSSKRGASARSSAASGSSSAFSSAPAATLISSNSDRIRVRTLASRPSYRDPTDREIAAETRRAERALDLAQKKRSAAEIEAEEAEDDIAMAEGEGEAEDSPVRRSTRAARSTKQREEEDEYEDAGDDAEEDDEEGEEEQGDDAFDPAEARRHLSRGAKDRGREKLAATIDAASTRGRDSSTKGPSMLDQILSTIESLGLHRSKGGFTVAKVRNAMVTERGGGAANGCGVGRFESNKETKTFNTAFGKAWGKGQLASAREATRSESRVTHRTWPESLC